MQYIVQYWAFGKGFWRLVNCVSFVTRAVAFVSRRRHRRRLCERLVVVEGLYVLWKNRCVAVIEQRHTSMLWLLVARLHTEV